MPTCKPLCLAKRTACATSSTFSGRTRTSGKRDGLRLFQIRACRALSYALSFGSRIRPERFILSLEKSGTRSDISGSNGNTRYVHLYATISNPKPAPLRMTKTPSQAKTGRLRRFDPQRRDRIIEAALKVIADLGVGRTTHRLVAERAGVPLGSMTYHFKDLEEVIWSAFEKFAARMQQNFENRLSRAAPTGDLVRAIAPPGEGDRSQQQADALLVLELYVLAIRHPVYRRLVEQWMASTRASIERHFSTQHTEVIDALVEGFFIHRVFSGSVPSPDAIAHALQVLTKETDPLGSVSGPRSKPSSSS
ncbi:MAG: TetR family transcriptional regulator [Mesorhizobium sp.]|nr:MAG: TetR family transcriptional regulator [Mesorhizobium sp.]